MLLFADIGCPDEPLPFAMQDDHDAILVGRAASIRMDPVTGEYVFADQSPGAAVMSMTASADKLIDLVLAHFTRGGQADTAETSLATIAKCVGNTKESVERALILATLRHCHGNRIQAADQLGISPQVLRGKLRSCWRDVASAKDDSPSGKHPAIFPSSRAAGAEAATSMHSIGNQTNKSNDPPG